MGILIAAIFVVIVVVIVFAMIPGKKPEPEPAKPVPLTPIQTEQLVAALSEVELRQLVVQLLLERQQPIKLEVTHKGDITQRHKLPSFVIWLPQHHSGHHHHHQGW
jgi:hypothetical protein